MEKKWVQKSTSKEELEQNGQFSEVVGPNMKQKNASVAEVG
jgi:hypothetical protein